MPYPATPPLHLVAFGTEDTGTARKRLRSQARKSGYFEKIDVLTETDLDPEFKARHNVRLSRDSRGYGYWLWKPKVILDALRTTPEGGFLLYVDVGCHVLPNQEAGIQRYLRMLEQTPSGILCSAMTQHLESQWTKKSLLVFLGVADKPQITQTPQHAATAIFFRKGAGAQEFVKRWLDICVMHPDLIDDSPSPVAEDPTFIEHRHDQSVFSLLSKLEGVATFDSVELLQWDNSSAQLSGSFPIEARRDRYPESLLTRARQGLFRNVGRKLRPLKTRCS